MQSVIHNLILKSTGANKAVRQAVIQRLWSGYGEIVRYRLTDCEWPSVIVKHVQFPAKSSHRSKAKADFSHQRKVRSYQVEMVWYERWSQRCGADCRIPSCLAVQRFEGDVILVLEDLDAAGFPRRKGRAGTVEMAVCLEWLANFHATFFGEPANGLWPTGTYWHLRTRPEELQALTDMPLKNAAVAIDSKLKASPFQTLVHGDAKLANFCFSADGKRVAAVDFQYVGGGCGIKDVAYFIDSCLEGDEVSRRESELLDIYFAALTRALIAKGKPVQPQAVEDNWRALYPLAWADFHRFLKGWSPGYWHPDSYSETVTRRVLEKLQNESGK